MNLIFSPCRPGILDSFSDFSDLLGVLADRAGLAGVLVDFPDVLVGCLGVFAVLLGVLLFTGVRFPSNSSSLSDSESESFLRAVGGFLPLPFLPIRSG